MKIEKLTENKIRVLTNVSNLDTDSFDIGNVFSNVINNKALFASILETADQQFGFNTDGCKLVIEAVSYLENIFVFTITKSSLSDADLKHPIAKPQNRKSSNSIYKFETFDEFCDFCGYIHDISNFDIKKFCKDISLYSYNDTYFLFVKNVNFSYEFASIFDCIATEFSTLISCDFSFENLLLEYGKIVIKNVKA